MSEDDPLEIRDRRQSELAAAIQRGTGRLLRQLGHSLVTELPLSTGRRADIVSLGGGGEVWIIEIKSSLADFQVDAKWPEYREHCDQFYFAVSPDFPVDVLPDDTGLMLADRYSAEIVRAAPEHKLSGARRKAVTLRFARAAALRLQTSLDPGVTSGFQD